MILYLQHSFVDLTSSDNSPPYFPHHFIAEGFLNNWICLLNKHIFVVLQSNLLLRYKLFLREKNWKNNYNLQLRLVSKNWGFKVKEKCKQYKILLMKNFIFIFHVIWTKFPMKSGLFLIEFTHATPLYHVEIKCKISMVYLAIRK